MFSLPSFEIVFASILQDESTQNSLKVKKIIGIILRSSKKIYLPLRLLFTCRYNIVKIVSISRTKAPWLDHPVIMRMIRRYIF